MSDAVLRVDGLSVSFTGMPAGTSAVERLSFEVPPGQTLAIVGESGCGKSITALALMGLLPMGQARVSEGSILFDGEDLARTSEQRMRQIRGNAMSMIFQEPMSALNPLMRIGDQLAESLREHRGVSRAQARRHAVELLQRVGIPEPELRAAEYPHRLSGGMRQRVMIAIAIACQPKVLIADEPTTALDVTVQRQILDLLGDLRRDFGMALVIITHDLGVVADIADRVVVMYAGRKVEEADVHELFRDPQHPYTRGLLAALPDTEEDALPRRRLIEIPGTVPRVLGQHAGCSFSGRCGQAMPRCSVEPAFEVRGGRGVACHLVIGDAA